MMLNLTSLSSHTVKGHQQSGEWSCTNPFFGELYKLLSFDRYFYFFGTSVLLSDNPDDNA